MTGLGNRTRRPWTAHWSCSSAAIPMPARAFPHFFFDEIRVVPGWERFLRRVLDTEEARVYVTGYSAKLLSTEVVASLRGRGLAVEVLPFGLEEAARSHGIETSAQRGKRIIAFIPVNAKPKTTGMTAMPLLLAMPFFFLSAKETNRITYY